MDDVDMVLGMALRRLRTKKKWSQEKLAFEASVDRNYISLIELGRNSPSVRMLLRLCNALGASTAAVLKDVERTLASAKSRE